MRILNLTLLIFSLSLMVSAFEPIPLENRGGILLADNSNQPSKSNSEMETEGETEMETEGDPKEESTLTKKISKIGSSLAAGREVHYLAYSVGYNIVQTFGQLPYFNVKYDYFFVGNNWFAEADVGMGYYLKYDKYPLYRRDFYENDLIINLDLTLAYSFGNTKIGYIKKGSKAVVPFVLFGPTLVYQGGFFNPGGVLGIGSILYPAKKSGFTLHYGVKNKIYFPKVYTTKFPTHNIHIYIGFQSRLKS